jgi:MoaA/NifB/PqqE/SkfB family radical SAM enzyme
MPTTYYLNLNYVCNERCVFCASDMTNSVRIDGRGAMLTLDQVERWLGDRRPGKHDQVMLAGGEPTIHRDLLSIVRALSSDCPDVVIFTNGVRLANADFARAAVQAGITNFEIALFGNTAETHEAVTRLPGSFERTLTALNVLDSLRPEFSFNIDLRLLVSRQTVDANPAIVRMVHERAAGVDSFSLNRLILSEHAADVDATISWADASASINASARLVRQFGYKLEYSAMPLCVFEDDNAEFVRNEVLRSIRQFDSRRWEMRYFDPLVAAGQMPTRTSRSPLAPLPVCSGCDLQSACGRVEGWYVERFGSAGLRSLKLQLV